MDNKRIRVRGAIKVASCVNGKIVRSMVLACVLVFGVTLSGCSEYGEPQQNSWEEYCDKYGVNCDEPTDKEIDYYLDCYVGSIEDSNNY